MASSGSLAAAVGLINGRTDMFKTLRSSFCAPSRQGRALDESAFDTTFRDDVSVFRLSLNSPRLQRAVFQLRNKGCLCYFHAILPAFLFYRVGRLTVALTTLVLSENSHTCRIS